MFGPRLHCIDSRMTMPLVTQRGQLPGSDRHELQSEFDLELVRLYEATRSARGSDFALRRATLLTASLGLVAVALGLAADRVSAGDSSIEGLLVATVVAACLGVISGSTAALISRVIIRRRRRRVKVLGAHARSIWEAYERALQGVAPNSKLHERGERAARTRA